MMMRIGSGLVVSAAGFLLAASVASAATLDDVRARGKLICGVSEGLPGFSDQDAAGAWHGFDVDFCRAVAAAALGDPDKVDYVPLSAVDRFDALKSGKIDLLSRNSTWTMSRDSVSASISPASAYYDGQGFLAPRQLRLHQRAGAPGRPHLRSSPGRPPKPMPAPISRQSTSTSHSCVSIPGPRRAPPTPSRSATSSPPTARRSPPSARSCSTCRTSM